MKIRVLLAILITAGEICAVERADTVTIILPDERTFLNISLENDLLTYPNSDRYFTHGITVDLQENRLSRWPLRIMMIPYRKEAFKTFNLYMVQQMYTPTSTRTEPGLKKDRPYASSLYFGYGRDLADQERKITLLSQLEVGFMGPYTPGYYLQTAVHKIFPANEAPIGWETQLKTDLILNYHARLQQVLVYKPYLLFQSGLNINLGTLYDNAGLLFHIRVGRADPLYGLSRSEKWPVIEYFFFARAEISYVAYNALLQGGMMNKNNVFVLTGPEIEHMVGHLEMGLQFRYKALGLGLTQNYLSPEYKGGFDHQWGKISISINF